MIPCTHFIAAYSGLFSYLDELGGPEAVERFWDYLADNFLGNLADLVKQNGIRGCLMYWSHTLNEEAATFTMELDEERGEFRIQMDQCPSKTRLLEYEHIEPYANYCGHCDVLYRRVLEPLGYHCTVDMSRTDQAMCELVVRSHA